MDIITLDSIIKKNKNLIDKGAVATYIPELAKVDKNLLGASIAFEDGNILSAGDTNFKFAIESISKTVALALALMDNGEDFIFKHVHKEPSGDAFNSIKKLETESDHLPKNPFINAGAIVIVSLIKGSSPDEKFNRILEFMKLICEDSTLELSYETYASEKATGDINRGLAYYMKGHGVLSGNVEEILDVYFKQCSILVTAESLAKLARFFAVGGVLSNGTRIIPKRYTQIINGLIATCGMYDQSGTYLDTIGIPGKSGVGGGIISPVSTKKLGIAVFGPSLDIEGNSVAGMGIMKDISENMKLDIF